MRDVRLWENEAARALSDAAPDASSLRRFLSQLIYINLSGALVM